MADISCGIEHSIEESRCAGINTQPLDAEIFDKDSAGGGGGIIIGYDVEIPCHNVGLGFVEVITACPVNWRKTPVECVQWIEDEVLAEFTLGEFKDVDQID